MRLALTSILPVLLPVAVVAASCSASNPPVGNTGGTTTTGVGGSGGDPDAHGLTIEPKDLLIDLPDGKPKSVTYKATLKDADGTRDVTDQAIWTIDDSELGYLQGPVFNTYDKPGTLHVHADALGWSASTSLTIKTSTVIITPGAPPDAPDKFGGTVDTSADKAPELVYPADGVLVPPNMNVLELQFRPGAGNDLFELTFTASSIVVKVYLTCSAVGTGCGYTPDADVWKLVAEAGRGGSPVQYVLRGVNMADPAKVGVAATRKISFAQEDMLGGLYYWAAQAGATMRYEFGKSGQSAELYMNGPQAGALFCVGCHVLSRDGSRIVEGLDIPAPSPYKVYDVATKTMLFAKPDANGGTGANFFSFSPDNKQLMASDGASIVLRDATTGADITTPLVAQGAMPDWSADGKRMVYAKGTALPFGGSPGVDSASLETMTLTGTTWSPGPSLVPFGGQNNYYPTYSPDNGWVMFNRSPSNKNSYDAPDAEVWVVSSAGGNPIKLANASTGGDSWPKWAPLAQQYQSGSIMWLTFASRRPYGLRLPAGGTAQIWMTAFDPARAAQGQDGSYPAFWLPFQDMASGNHIAQWVLHVDRKPCSDKSECEANEDCQNGTCQPVPK